MAEYKRVSEMNYEEYCDYLQNKYGIGVTDYMTRSFNKNPKCTRTKDGLLAHHKMEDCMIMLSDKNIAQECPFEWQKKENIVYCDYLEHLFLHILICKYPSPLTRNIVDVGFGGVVNFLVPELNDLYSGWITNQAWRLNCHKKVIADKDVYLVLLKRFIAFAEDNYTGFDVSALFSSFNEQYGLWSRKRNMQLYQEIANL